jgi:hypothetical protein
MIKKFSESLKQQADKAKDSLTGTTDKLKELGNSGIDQARDAMTAINEQIGELKEAGMDKIKAGIEELSSGMPLIEQSGFQIKDITLGLGIPPQVSIALAKTKAVESADIQKLIDANQDKKILCAILQALQTANNVQSKITMGKFLFTGVGIKMGIPPEVSLRYS